MKPWMIGSLAVVAFAGCSSATGEQSAARGKSTGVTVTSAVYDGTGLFLTVKNTGDVPIGALDCEIVNRSPGRAIDNGSGSVAYTIDGGIEPGETKQLHQIVLPFESDLWLRKGLDSGNQLFVIVDGADNPEFLVDYRPR